MTRVKAVLNTEIRTAEKFDFSVRVLARQVVSAVIRAENCPFDVSVDLIVADAEEIRELNRQFRGIDSETDVLSFPGVSFDPPSDFAILSPGDPEYFDPDTGLLCLGGIALDASRVKSQAALYGHSEKREFAFLTAHSVLHLCGYDHETPEEAKQMEAKQEQILNRLGITRDSI